MNHHDDFGWFLNLIADFFYYFWTFVGFVITFVYVHPFLTLLFIVLFFMVACLWARWRDDDEVEIVYPTDTVSQDADFRLQQIAETRKFTEALVLIQQNTVLSARKKLQEIDTTYERMLKRLEAAGELTPRVEEEINAFARASVRGITGLTVNFATSLSWLADTDEAPHVRGYRRNRSIE